MRRRHPVVIVDAINDKDSRLRGLGMRIAKRYGQKREGAQRKLPSRNGHEM
jgi:hypothetical protein